MKRYGIFSGWFTLFGVRGRISHILVLLMGWLTFVVAFLFLFYGGLGIIFTLSFENLRFNNFPSIWVISLGVLLVLCFWMSICVTTQRLRHIGFRGIILFILVIIAIFPLPIQYFFSIDENVFNIVFGVYALIIFLYPGKKQEFFVKKELNITHERTEPRV